jgi:hypothetical protein
MTTCAAFIKESRMNFAEPIALNRKFGGVESLPDLAEGDLRFSQSASDAQRKLRPSALMRGRELSGG